MNHSARKSSSVEEYIKGFPAEIQDLLEEIRKIIREKAPQAVEGIAYGMPAYKLGGRPMVYFAGHKKHIGFYATPSGHNAFSKELMGYRQGKGSVQFPLDKPLPHDLIGRMVQFKVQELTKPEAPPKGKDQSE